MCAIVKTVSRCCAGAWYHSKRLAVLVGVSQSMLTNYENGSSIPRDQEVWDRLAVYFGVSVPYLMGFEFDVTAGFNVRPAVFMPAWWR